MIEIKTLKGKVSPPQEAFITEAKRKGAKVFVARSVEDVINEGI